MQGLGLAEEVRDQGPDLSRLGIPSKHVKTMVSKKAGCSKSGSGSHESYKNHPSAGHLISGFSLSKAGMCRCVKVATARAAAHS